MPQGLASEVIRIKVSFTIALIYSAVAGILVEEKRAAIIGKVWLVNDGSVGAGERLVVGFFNLDR